MAGKYEIKTGAKGTFHFTLKAGNGEVIASGQSYTTLEACQGGIESVRKNAPIAALEDQTVEGFEKATNPKFEVYTDNAGETRFRLKARNGEIIAASGGYRSKASCMKGIASVRKNGEEARVVRIE